MIDTLHSDQWDCRIIPAKKWAYSHTYIPVSLFNLLPVPTIKWCPGCISTLRSYTDLEEEEGCHQQGWICNHFKRASFTETSHQWSVYSHAKFSSQSTTNIISSWQYYIAGWGVSQPRNHNQLKFLRVEILQQPSYVIRTHWFGSTGSNCLDHGREWTLWIW